MLQQPDNILLYFCSLVSLSCVPECGYFYGYTLVLFHSLLLYVCMIYLFLTVQFCLCQPPSRLHLSLTAQFLSCSSVCSFFNKYWEYFWGHTPYCTYTVSTVLLFTTKTAMINLLSLPKWVNSCFLHIFNISNYRQTLNGSGIQVSSQQVILYFTGPIGFFSINY